MHRVDEAGVEKLPDGGGPAAESDVGALRRDPRPVEDRRRIGVDEVERGVAKDERRTRVVGQRGDRLYPDEFVLVKPRRGAVDGAAVFCAWTAPTTPPITSRPA